MSFYARLQHWKDVGCVHYRDINLSMNRSQRLKSCFMTRPIWVLYPSTRKCIEATARRRIAEQPNLCERKTVVMDKLQWWTTSGYLWSEEISGVQWWILTFICCSGVFKRRQTDFQDILLSIPLWSPKWKLHPFQDLKRVRICQWSHPRDPPVSRNVSLLKLLFCPSRCRKVG